MPPLLRVLCALLGALFFAWPLLAFGQGTPIYGNRVMTGHMNFCKPVGGSDVYACNLVSAITAYVEGAEYSFEADVANTGVATINFNSVGARTIKKYNQNITADLADSDICAGQQVIVRYDGTNMQMISPLCNAAGGGVTDGDKGDITVSASGATYTIDNDVVTYAKMQNVSATDRLLGRDTAGAGDVEEITPANVKTMLAISCADLTDEGTGCAGVGLTDGDKGDITVSSTGTVLTIDADVVTYAKLQNVSATDRLLGRDTAGAGDVEELDATAVKTILALNNVDNTSNATERAATRTLTNATFDLTDNTLVGTLAELNTAISDANLVPEARTLTAGFGIQTLGDLSANRTVAMEAPGADDQLYVSDSTSDATWRSVPNCTDAGGQHLNYTAATNSFSCGTTGDGAGSGTQVALDLGNDASNESTAVTKITTTGDTNSIFSEPNADELRINVGLDWPKADLADAATALAANGGNCSSGSAPLGVDTLGAVEGCFDVATQVELDAYDTLTKTLTNTTFDLTDNTLVGTLAELNTAITDANLVPEARTITIAGTANQITSSAGAQDLSANRTWTLSIPTNPTLPGTTTGTFSGNLTGNVTGNADTATALAANGANCSAGQAPLGVNASGAAEGCFSVVRKHAFAVSAQTSVTVTGATHGLGTDDIQVQCWTNTNPRVKEEAGWTVNSSSFDVIVTWGVAFTGRCNIQG